MANAFTGESDITLTTDISNTTVTPGAYPDSSVGLVPTFEVAADGRLTAAGSYTPTLPSSNLQLSGTDKAVLFNNSNSVGYADGFSIDSKTLKLGTADLNTAKIDYNGSNASRAILRIHGPNNTNTLSNNFGFDIAYMGARTGNANSLSIFADNGNNKIEAIQILQNGNTGFGVVSTNSSTTAEHTIPSSGGGVVTVGKLKAREIEVSGNITVNNELTGFDFLDLGDTPSTYTNKTGQFPKVGTQNGEPGLVFSTISAGDIQNLTSTIQSTNLTSSQVTDLTTTIQSTNLTSSQVTDLTTTINNTVTDTNHTYDLGVQSGGKIRLTTGGSGSGTDDVTLAAGDNVTIESTQTGTSEGTITISASGGPDVTSTDNNQNIRIKNTAPTIFMIDTNHKNSYLRTDSNAFYILAGTSESTWETSTPNGRFPFVLNLNNYNINFGAAIDVKTTVYAGGNITAFSDVRLKENIKPIENAIEKVSAINGVTFTRIDDEENIKYAGLIAQEVEEVLPEVVRENEDGYKTLDYGNVAGLLVEAIKDLKEEINTLREEVSDLRSQIQGGWHTCPDAL